MWSSLATASWTWWLALSWGPSLSKSTPRSNDGPSRVGSDQTRSGHQRAEERRPRPTGVSRRTSSGNRSKRNLHPHGVRTPLWLLLRRSVVGGRRCSQEDARDWQAALTGSVRSRRSAACSLCRHLSSGHLLPQRGKAPGRQCLDGSGPALDSFRYLGFGPIAPVAKHQNRTLSEGEPQQDVDHLGRLKRDPFRRRRGVSSLPRSPSMSVLTQVHNNGSEVATGLFE